MLMMIFLSSLMAIWAIFKLYCWTSTSIWSKAWLETLNENHDVLLRNCDVMKFWRHLWTFVYWYYFCTHLLFHTNPKINSGSRWEWNMKLEVIQHLFGTNYWMHLLDNEGLFWILNKSDGLTFHWWHSWGYGHMHCCFVISSFSWTNITITSKCFWIFFL